MGNRKSREFRKRQADEDRLNSAWAQARTIPRRFDDKLGIPGLGFRRLQVVVAPSFDPGYGWDLRMTDGPWRVFRSQVVEGEWFGRLIGYEELVASSALIQQHVEHLCAVSIPVQPLLHHRPGIDGTYSTLMIAGGFYSALRVEWWTEYPDHWEPLVRRTDALVATLRQCPVKEDPDGTPT